MSYLFDLYNLVEGKNMVVKKHMHILVLVLQLFYLFLFII